MAASAVWDSPRIVTGRSRSSSREPVERREQRRPAGVPRRQQRGAIARRRLELGVALAPRLLAVAGEEIGPPRLHVAGEVAHQHRDAVGLGIEPRVELRVVELGDGAVGQRLDLAELAGERGDYHADRRDAARLTPCRRRVARRRCRRRRRRRRWRRRRRPARQRGLGVVAGFGLGLHEVRQGVVGRGGAGLGLVVEPVDAAGELGRESDRADRVPSAANPAFGPFLPFGGAGGPKLR